MNLHVCDFASGALVTLRGDSGRDVLAGMVGNEESRQPGSADGLTTQSLEAILVRSVSKCKELNAACPRGSSRHSVTASASTNNGPSSRSVKTGLGNPVQHDKPRVSAQSGFCPGNGQVVDSCRTRSLAGSLTQSVRDNLSSRNRNVLPLNGVGSTSEEERKNQWSGSKELRQAWNLTLSVGLKNEHSQGTMFDERELAACCLAHLDGKGRCF